MNNERYKNLMNIINFQDFNLDEIKWKKIEKTGKDKYLIPIYKEYDGDKEIKKPLIFQTPKLYLPFKPDLNYLSLSFYNYEYDIKNSEFEHFLCNLDKYLSSPKIQTKLTKKGFKLNKREIRSVLYYPQNTTYPVFLLHYSRNNVKVFNQYKQLITWDEIEGRVYGCFIFELIGIWISNDKYGFSFDLKQAKFYPPIIFDDYMFLDDNEPNEPINIIKLKDYQPMSQYIKMMKIGIPKECIKQKMMLSGIDPKIIDYDLSTHINDIPEIRNNNLEIKENLKEVNDLDNLKINNSDGKISLSNILSNGILGNHLKNLKKIEPEIKPKKKFKPHSFPVPDLEEIQNAIQKLKKIDDNNTID
jgi:hypothetical protein